MSLFSKLAHLLPARTFARIGAHFRKVFADPFDVLNRYYFASPWLERKMTTDCCD